MAREYVRTDDAGYPPDYTVDDRATTQRVTTTDVSWSPAQLVILAAGAVLVVFGVIAVVRGGLSGDITRPYVDVFGFSHTPLLGLIEMGAGVLLILSGLGSAGRPLAMLIGVALVIGGVLTLSSMDWIHTHLTTDNSYGWVPIICGGAVVIAAALLPSIRRRKVVER
jgi:hypothetical protein